MSQEKKLKDALENIVIAFDMGWDLDGVMEVGRTALADLNETKVIIKPEARVCTKCEGTGHLVEKGGIIDNRFHCRYCKGTGVIE